MEMDLYARQLVVASLLYYSLDMECMSDGEFDEKVQIVAQNFDKLDPVRRWMLGSAESMLISGFKFRATVAAAHAAAHKVRSIRGSGSGPVIYPTNQWQFSKKHQLEWLYVSQFSLSQ